jgi:hypothetical protein
MDQFAMGINLQIPASDISQRVKNAPQSNEYVGRLAYLLQPGRPVADIALLYPIAALQTTYDFSGGQLAENAKPETDRSITELAGMMGPAWEYAYNGGAMPSEIDYEIDYMDVGEFFVAAFALLSADTHRHCGVFPAHVWHGELAQQVAGAGYCGSGEDG